MGDSPRRPRIAVPLALTVVVTGGAGCEGSAPARETVEIIDWWVNAGEAPALGALTEMFETQNPNQRILNTALDTSTDARKRINERMVARQPPETFQANGGWDLLAWVVTNEVDDKGTKMVPLDGWVDWATAFPDPVLETVRFGDSIYGVPLGIHRVNTLFFNRDVFTKLDLPAPSTEKLATLDDLFALAATLRARGVATPIALGMRDPWPLSLLLFENILVARAGGAGYRRFFAGTDGVLSSPTMATALADLNTLLGYTNADASRTTWDQAIDLVLRGDAAMTIMGDWAKGYVLDLARKDAVPINVGQIPTPGTDGTFVFTTDTFGLPIGARNPKGARALLALFASVEGQDAFSLIKGSIPARQDAGRGPYDQDALNTLGEFRKVSGDHNRLVPATAIVAPPEYMNAINDALSDFVGTTTHVGDVRGNTSVVLRALENRRDMLGSGPWH
jgi:glucose/mannose transport system substrate-binding protein